MVLTPSLTIFGTICNKCLLKSFKFIFCKCKLVSIYYKTFYFQYRKNKYYFLIEFHLNEKFNENEILQMKYKVVQTLFDRYLLALNFQYGICTVYEIYNKICFYKYFFPYLQDHRLDLSILKNFIPLINKLIFECKVYYT